jgi:hypothetical protein
MTLDAAKTTTTAQLHACAVGRMTISFTSISAGCSIANAIVHPPASRAGRWSLVSASCALTSDWSHCRQSWYA